MVNFIWDNFFRTNNDTNDLQKKLKENVLFKDLSSSELKMIEKIVNIRSYRPGEQIFKQGDPGVGMYIILKGTVDLYAEDINTSTQQPMSTHITSLKKDDFFGELALAEQDDRRSASAVAHDEVVLIGFYKPDLIELAQRNPAAGVKVLARLAEVLGARLRKTTGKLSELKRESKHEPNR